MIELPTLVAGLLGLMSPVVIGLIKRKIASTLLRWFIALVVSAGVGVLGALIANGAPGVENIITWAGTAWGMSQTAWTTWRAIAKDAGLK